ncbi:coiled-coil domain-containing protein 169-like [Dendronephthya gigantea]|uniref:coiled-coil domain-containing protein 169-like n=1 Tax=Dendronephthya gigantea TaxID=151771 RepID=UPI00106B9CCE|nr:coiled-coil domain-containing protein 169-like [Dendronephthya gigantea]
MATALRKLTVQDDNPQVEMDNEIMRLREEIEQEKQMKQMLDQSKYELEQTVDRLSEKQDSIDDEDNEWKTRYQTQYQINEQLEKQKIMLQDKLQSFRESSKNGNRHIQKRTNKEELSDVDIKKLMKQLDREKIDLEGQLKDLEWRLNNESRSFHKLEEDRKMYATELQETRAVIGETKAKHRHVLNDMQRENETNHWPEKRLSGKFGLPDNQRIIDPSKGPVKKTAVVRRLPKLKNNNTSVRNNKSSNGSR